MQEFKIVYSGDMNYEFDKLMFGVFQINGTEIFVLMTLLRSIRVTVV